jgi:MFS transporter, putative metabolite:H+ symporter
MSDGRDSKATDDSEKAGSYIARLERLPAWGLPYGLVWAIGFSWFVTSYDATGNVGPALPYMVSQGFFPGAPSQALGEALFGAITLALVGYPVGAISLSYLADRIGRKPGMMVSVLLTAVGELGLTFSPSYVAWDFFRFVVGCGIGAGLALVTTYVSEMSPTAKRGPYLNGTFVVGWIGASLGILLATQIVIHDPVAGWRIVFGLGAAFAVATLVIWARAPESVRYLAKTHKFDEAERIISSMERSSMKRAHLASLPEPKKISFPLINRNPLKELTNPEYLKRIVVLFVFWFFLYWVQYPFSVAWNTYFTGEFSYSPSETTTAIALFGYLAVGTTAGALLVRPLLNHVDRRFLATLTALAWPVGLFIALQGGPSRNYVEIAVGILLIDVIAGGFMYQLMYLMSAESFPTASRSTGSSLTEGLGHLGGAIAPAVLLPLTVVVGQGYAFPIMGIPVVVAGLLVIAFIPKTVGKTLEEVNEALVPASTEA